MTAVIDGPKERLLQIAIERFAVLGFAGAPVREICRQAGTNVAAINYYFGDKERLYIEAVKQAHCCWADAVPWNEPPPNTPPLKKLHSFITVMVARMVREPNPFATQLIMREMAHPTNACAELVRDAIRPMADKLMAIISELLPNSTERERYRIGFSIVGQCLFYKQNRPVARQLMGEDAFDSMTVEEITNHIYEFSLQGIANRENA